MNIYKLDVFTYDGDPCRQAVVSNKGKRVFSAYDLYDCPEDATIYRELFNANDYIRALRQGMLLAQHGYDNIEIIDHEFNSYDDYLDAIYEAENK